MIIEIDPTFKTALLNVLSKYQEKKRFKEDCTTLQCMVNTRKHRGIPIEGISNLVDTIVNYCKKELRSNTIRLPLNWKFTIQTKRNGLYLALKRTVHEQMTQALVRENALCHMTLRMLPTPAEVSAMQAQKNQLEEDLTAMTNRADQAELDSSTKQKRIEKLVKENKILDQQLKSTQEELDRLKGKVIYLEEEKIPTLAADFKRQLKDFQDEMKRETEKQDSFD